MHLQELGKTCWGERREICLLCSHCHNLIATYLWFAPLWFTNIYIASDCEKTGGSFSNPVLWSCLYSKDELYIIYFIFPTLQERLKHSEIMMVKQHLTLQRGENMILWLLFSPQVCLDVAFLSFLTLSFLNLDCVLYLITDSYCWWLPFLAGGWLHSACCTLHFVTSWLCWERCSRTGNLLLISMQIHKFPCLHIRNVVLHILICLWWWQQRNKHKQRQWMGNAITSVAKWTLKVFLQQHKPTRK